MRHNVYTFFSVHNCLDEEFDAPDIAADRDLCHAIGAGKVGLHPDAWGAHDPLTLLPPRWRRERPYERVYHPSPADLKAAKHWPRPVKEPPRERKRPGPKPTWVHAPEPEIDDKYGGTIQLSCDDCGAKFRFLPTYDHGQRARRAAQLRELGRDKGWTHVAGRDRCPMCSVIPASGPLDVDQRGVV